MAIEKASNFETKNAPRHSENRPSKVPGKNLAKFQVAGYGLFGPCGPFLAVGGGAMRVPKWCHLQLNWYTIPLNVPCRWFSGFDIHRAIDWEKSYDFCIALGLVCVLPMKFSIIGDHPRNGLVKWMLWNPLGFLTKPGKWTVGEMVCCFLTP